MLVDKTMMVCSLTLLAIVASPVAAQQRITNWPADIPCDAFRLSPDGQTLTQIKAIIVGNALLTGNTFQNTAETRMYSQKCSVHH
jgi:hypothetical protein